MKKYLQILFFIILAIAVSSLWLSALFHISNLWRGDSDNAFALMNGYSILQGNFLLKGYSSVYLNISADTYFYALWIKAFGFRPLLIHIIPLFQFIVLIAAAVFYVKEAGGNNPEDDEISTKIGIFMLFVFLAMPVKAFAFFMLQGMHVSTIILSLIAVFILAGFLKSESGGFFRLLLSFFVLTIAIINDSLTLVVCVMPLLSVMAAFIYTAFKTGKGVKKSRILLSALAVISAVTLKKIVVYAFVVSGRLSVKPGGPAAAFVRLRDFPRNIYLYFSGLLRLFDANFFGKNLSDKFTFISLSKFAIISLILIYTVPKLIKKFLNKFKGKEGRNHEYFYSKEFIDFTLLFGGIFLTLAFLLSNIPENKASARYLTPLAVYWLILSFRNIPAAVSKYYSRTGFKLTAAAVIIVYSVSFIYASLTPIPKSPERALGNWLLKRNLTHGYGSYWDSGIITLMTYGKVTVGQAAPILFNGLFHRYDCSPEKKRYENKRFFVVYSKYFIYQGVNKQSIICRFGKPSKIYVEDFQGTSGRAYGRIAGKYSRPPYVIMVYDDGAGKGKK